MGFVDTVKAKDVCDADTLANYICQTVGTPYSNRDKNQLGKKAAEFFELYPNTNWFTLCRVADWARAKKKRPPHCFMIIDYVRYAWSDGIVPELDPSNNKETDEELETQIYEALQVETDRTWRYRLIGAQGVEARREVFNEWTQKDIKVAS